MEYFTTTEVAKMLGFSKQSIVAWIHSGKLKAVKVSREYRIPKDELNRLLQESLIVTASPKSDE